jgi:5-methylcytosine-specific restriction endonuclease McrA
MVISYAEYVEYIKSPQWKAKANAMKARMPWCALCPAVSNLEVHHRTYVRIGREPAADLVVLCSKCHRRHHGTFDECMERQMALPFDLPMAA